MKTQDFSKSLRNLVVLAAVLVAAQATTTKAELIYGVSDTLNDLVSFNSATPGTVNAVGLSGLHSGDALRGIDIVGGTLYGLGDQGYLYTVNTSTGVATMVGTGLGATLNGVYFGFNAGTSQLYVSSDAGLNLTINPLTGVATAGPTYTFGGQPADGDAMAYNYASSSFYGISVGGSQLFNLNPATGGVTVAATIPSGTLEHPVGFDISPNTGVAYVATVTTPGGTPDLFTLNLSTGSLTDTGTIGHTGELAGGLDGIAVSPVPEPGTLSLLVAGGSYMLFGLIRRKK